MLPLGIGQSGSNFRLARVERGLLVAGWGDAAHHRLVQFLADEAGLAVQSCRLERHPVVTALRQNHPEVLVLDGGVQEMSAWHMLRFLRNRNEGVEVVLLGHFDLPCFHQACAALGPARYLPRTRAAEELPRLLHSFHWRSMVARAVPPPAADQAIQPVYQVLA